MKKNEGEVPQYYVEGNHEAIISPEVFDMVQAELERRKRSKNSRYSGVSIFSNKIKCGCCGAWFGSKVWHSTDKYRRVIYRCNRKYDSEKCDTPHITEDEIKAVFIKAVNQLITEKKEIISNLEMIMKTISDTSALVTERDKLRDELEIIVEMTHSCVAENARKAQDQEEYQKKYNELVTRYETSKNRYDDLVYAIEQKKSQSEKIQQFIGALKSQDGFITEFDEALWSTMIDFITVGKEDCTVTFRDGTEIKI